VCFAGIWQWWHWAWWCQGLLQWCICLHSFYNNDRRLVPTLRKGSCTWGEVHLQVFVFSSISFPPFVSPWFCLYSRFPGFCFSNLVNLVEATCFTFVCSCFLELWSTSYAIISTSGSKSAMLYCAIPAMSHNQVFV
jgi:hypothetical protein